ncbi:MAG: hypothetical protein DMF69_07715 [Acidobacteria bacterium]|nr:MAG: hypothetical protein DMF69_07715 [Acidobacteriota bacterium]
MLSFPFASTQLITWRCRREIQESFRLAFSITAHRWFCLSPGQDNRQHQGKSQGRNRLSEWHKGREVTSVTTEKGGDFTVSRLPPGVYGLTLRKPGLSIGTLENIEVKAGKTRSVGERLFLTIDEGAIAFVRGSVFNAADRSVPNAKVELLKVDTDGSTKKIDSRLTTETGSFAFRLAPDVAKYRVTVKVEGTEVSKDVEIDGAAIYRVALSLAPPAKP